MTGLTLCNTKKRGGAWRLRMGSYLSALSMPVANKLRGIVWEGQSRSTAHSQVTGCGEAKRGTFPCIGLFELVSLQRPEAPLATPRLPRSGQCKAARDDSRTRCPYHHVLITGLSWRIERKPVLSCARESCHDGCAGGRPGQGKATQDDSRTRSAASLDSHHRTELADRTKINPTGCV